MGFLTGLKKRQQRELQVPRENETLADREAQRRILELTKDAPSFVPSGTAAVEIAANAWSWAISGADITQRRGAITKHMLAWLGRDLIRDGESVWLIDVEGGMIELIRVNSYSILGGIRESSWSYQVTIPGPSDTITRTVSREQVLHFRWSTERARPWRGIPPWKSANITANALAGIEQSLADESRIPTGMMMIIPGNEYRNDGTDTTGGVAELLRNLRGQFLVASSGTNAWDRPYNPRSSEEYVTKRIGPNPPQTFTIIRSEAEAAILSACGVPAGLYLDRDGTAAREALRRFFNIAVEPVTQRLAEEFSRGLDEEISFSFRFAWAHDIVGRVNAFQRLVAGGMTSEQALEHSGLNEV